MSTKQEKQKLRQRKTCSPHHVSSIQKAAMFAREPKENRGCCRGLAVILSMLSETKHPQTPRDHHQVRELKDDVRKQKDLNQLERVQDYPIANNQHPYPAETATELGGPHLEAIKVQAKMGGWDIGPHEIEVHEKIGQGTTADIYRGTWRGLDVAVKWIYPHYFQTNESCETWFAQELDILSRQRHPFVLRLMGACLQPPENGWIVTELSSGKTLTEWLYGHKQRQKERSISLPPLHERIEKGLEIAQAMQYLHEQKPKVIHRDLKPSNILLDDSMHVRVADFGHARFLPDGEQALTGEMGTYVYMAPEVIRYEPYDEKCDVYSFAIILNELITGDHPYSESSYGPSQIATEVAEGRLRPKLPEEDHQYKELIELICRAWNNDASARPSFAIITSDLRKILEKLMLSQIPTV